MKQLITSMNRNDFEKSSAYSITYSEEFSGKTKEMTSKKGTKYNSTKVGYFPARNAQGYSNFDIPESVAKKLEKVEFPVKAQLQFEVVYGNARIVDVVLDEEK